MAEKICDGVYLIGRYSPYKCGAWVLVHNNEAATIEMPPGQSGRSKPWDDVKTFLKDNDLELRWLLLTHAHIDHTGGYARYRRSFPEACILVHRSFLGWYHREAFDEIFYRPHTELSLGGEPLLLVHAPKHSAQDTLLFFRGAVCTGDWSLGKYMDSNPLVAPSVKVKSCEFVKSFLSQRNYHVHTAFSAHGNEVRKNVDFPGLLDEMRDFWKTFPETEWKNTARAWFKWSLKLAKEVGPE